MQTGDCRRECSTIAKVCETVLEDTDTDLSELLVHDKPLAAVTHALCHELTPSCVKATPKFSGPRPDGEEWVPVDEQQLQMQRMLAQMEADGMSGSVRFLAAALHCP